VRSIIHGVRGFQCGATETQKEDAQKDGQHGIGKPRSEFEEPSRKESEEDRCGWNGLITVGLFGGPYRVLVEHQYHPCGCVQGQEQPDGEGTDTARVSRRTDGR